MNRLRFLLLSLILYYPNGFADEGGKAILMVVTSHGAIEEGHPTGIWLEEFAVPFELFSAAGHRITVASPRGGKAPLDPRSTADAAKDYQPDTLLALEDTLDLDGLDLSGFDAVFFPGGHGTMFDLPGDDRVSSIASYFIASDKPSAFVCHGPAALVNATLPDGTSVVAGRKVTGFTNAEEDAVELTEKMPFLLESKLKELGAQFAGADNFVEHIVTDGNLITGQNPASSKAAAQALLEQLNR
jgi:putative intracellular protease/amidase